MARVVGYLRDPDWRIRTHGARLLAILVRQGHVSIEEASVAAAALLVEGRAWLVLSGLAALRGLGKGAGIKAAAVAEVLSREEEEITSEAARLLDMWGVDGGGNDEGG